MWIDDELNKHIMCAAGHHFYIEVWTSYRPRLCRPIVYQLNVLSHADASVPRMWYHTSHTAPRPRPWSAMRESALCPSQTADATRARVVRNGATRRMTETINSGRNKLTARVSVFVCGCFLFVGTIHIWYTRRTVMSAIGCCPFYD